MVDTPLQDLEDILRYYSWNLDNPTEIETRDTDG
jgi:hypothetical protein